MAFRLPRMRVELHSARSKMLVPAAVAVAADLTVGRPVQESIHDLAHE